MPQNSARVYLRGEAYLMLHGGNAAEVEFQKFIDHRGVVMNFPWGARARLGLARSYALQGDTAKAKAVYQAFLTLWKDADPDIPILIWFADVEVRRGPLSPLKILRKKFLFHVLRGLYQIVRPAEITPIILIGSKGEDFFPGGSKT